MMRIMPAEMKEERMKTTFKSINFKLVFVATAWPINKYITSTVAYFI